MTPSSGGSLKARDNEAGRRTSAQKLLGQVFTPIQVARRMLAMVAWPAGSSVLIDPSCGDGVFLEAAIRKVLAMGLPQPEVISVLEQRLVGWDVDATHVARCHDRMERLLEEAGLSGIRFRVECRDALASSVDIPSACVVGNPPYLEAKRMPDALKQLIRASYPEAANGGFDLFGAFVALALRLTSRHGEVCLLLPNRFLTGAYAARLRQRLWDAYTPEVHDLSTERVFPDAAVYPVIVHARRRDRNQGPASPAKMFAFRRWNRESAPPVLTSDIWPATPADPQGSRLVHRLMNDPSFERVGQVAAVRWTVSFHRAGWRDVFVFRDAPRDARHLRRFLGGGRFHGNREVLPFRIRWDGWWIDYDEERAKRLKNALPPLHLFESPKVVVCQNARRLRAAVDRDGFVLKDTFLAVIPRTAGGRSFPAKGMEGPFIFPPCPGTGRGQGAPTLEWLCILLHSDVMHYLYEHLFAGTRKAGGYLQYLPRFMAVLPVAPCPDEEAAVRVASRLSAGEPAWREAEALVLEAFHVTRAEKKALAEYPFPPHAMEGAVPKSRGMEPIGLSFPGPKRLGLNVPVPAEVRCLLDSTTNDWKSTR